ncbi:MAG: MFS transporter [Syntrophales bacterium LBB04]|nr:MFS transporter [Syntrophales bacterium LBB04]
MKKSFFYGYIIVSACFILQAAMITPRGTFGVFIKPLTTIMFCLIFCLITILVHIVPLAMDTGISAISASLILTVMNLAMTAGSVGVGLIADKISSRIPFVICLYLLSGVMLLLLPVTSAWLLGIFMVVMGLGGGGLAVLEATIVPELFGLKSNGVILGSVVFLHTLGGATGAYLAGLVFDATGNYQWIILICTILSIAAIIMAIILNRITQPASKSRIITVDQD